MSASPFTVTIPKARPVPLVVDSPHGGRDYPADFNHACPRPMLRQTEDFLVDELIAGASEAGATVVAATFPRCYIDTNRTEDDLDPAVLAEPWPMPLKPSERTLQGLGLVRRLCRSGVPVYHAPLKAADVQNRIENYYRPYHQALDAVLAAHRRAFGHCTLINCHSMPNLPARGGRPHADIVLGDRMGSSCDPSFTRLVHQWFHDHGYTVALNDPYKGAEIVRRYGRPQEGQMALQLEINRHLYMNEETLEKVSGFELLKQDLTEFFCDIAAELMRDADERMAAE